MKPRNPREPPAALPHRPRLGFLGVGWIGRNRMEAIAMDGAAEIVAIADADPQMRDAARAGAGRGIARLLDALLDLRAGRPGDRHAERAARAAGRSGARAGIAVFCQKPLARTAAETRSVIDAARQGRPAAGRGPVVPAHRRRCSASANAWWPATIGEVYAVDLVFHNAYGPDKPWFRDPLLSGGGCVIDLGIHMVDLALWTLGFPRVQSVSSRLHAGGRKLALPSAEVEDHAVAQIDLANGCVVRLACSWNLPAAAMRSSRRTFTAPAAAPRCATSTARSTTSSPSASTARAHAARRSARRLGRPRGGALGARAGGGGRFDPEIERGWCRWPRCWMRSMAAESQPCAACADDGDTVGGVWTMPWSLRGLVRRGMRVSLATMGAPLTPAQREQAAACRRHAARKQLAPRMDGRCPRRRVPRGRLAAGLERGCGPTSCT
jgi:predicted dehydrogenase